MCLRSGAVRLNRPDSRRGRERVPPELLFVISAISQYVGASIAVGLFDRVEPRIVAWFRVLGASIALLAVSPRFWVGWNRSKLAGAAIFGVATALMNLFFYLAIAEIDLGKGVAIEFLGPITVAAALTRTKRNLAALVLTGFGVVVLGGVEVGNNTKGLVFILLASAMWAAYIIAGSKVALQRSDLSGLGVGLAIGTLVLAPVGLPGSALVWTTPSLLIAACATGVFSNAIGYGIDQFVLRRVAVRRFSLLLATLPVTAVLIGWVALGQRPQTSDWLGIALVLGGVILQDRDDAASELAPPEPS